MLALTCALDASDLVALYVCRAARAHRICVTCNTGLVGPMRHHRPVSPHRQGYIGLRFAGSVARGPGALLRVRRRDIVQVYMRIG